MDAIYADAEIYPDDDICKIFASTSLIGIGYAVVAAFRPPVKGLGFSILKPMKNSVSDNISNQFNLFSTQMTVCIYPFKRKKECNISYF